VLARIDDLDAVGVCMASRWPVIASQPYPARYRMRTLNRAFVTASGARHSMQSGVMDCFTAFAMTATFTMTGLFMESGARQSRTFWAHGLPRRWRSSQ
jgi:hypothetical protein